MWDILSEPMVSPPVEFSAGRVTHHLEGIHPYSPCSSGMGRAGKTVLARCDNAAVVAIINSGSSKDVDVMHLMRYLAFVAAKFNFVNASRHIRGVENDLADVLSRDKVNYFHSLNHTPQKSPPSC